MQQESALPCKIQESQKVMQTQGNSLRPCQALEKKGPSSPLWRSRQKQSRCTEDEILVPSKDPTREAPVPGCKAGYGRILKDLYMISANAPMKVPSAKPELERVEPRQKASRSPGGPYEQEGTADA